VTWRSEAIEKKQEATRSYLPGVESMITRGVSAPARLALVVVLVVAVRGTARADVLHLASGGQVEGEIVREESSEIEIRAPFGSAVIPRSQIRSIDRKPTPEQEFQSRRAALRPDDANGRVELARFVTDAHVTKAALRVSELAIEAWKIDPRSEGALDLLAKADDRFDPANGTWTAPEVWYPAHGFVRRNGRFMTNEESALLDAQAVTSAAADAVAAAEASVRAAGETVTRAAIDEPAALARARALQTTATVLDPSIMAARAVLDTRETDLKIAADARLAAHRDTQRAAGQPNVGWYVEAERRAIERERAAACSRDEALAGLTQLTDQQARIPDQIDAARQAAADARAAGLAATADLPRRRAAVVDASAALARVRVAEAAARTAFLDRKAAEERAEAARVEALRTWKKS
jgi:hypothetical protein